MDRTGLADGFTRTAIGTSRGSVCSRKSSEPFWPARGSGRQSSPHENANSVPSAAVLTGYSANEWRARSQRETEAAITKGWADRSSAAIDAGDTLLPASHDDPGCHDQTRGKAALEEQLEPIIMGVIDELVGDFVRAARTSGTRAGTIQCRSRTGKTASAAAHVVRAICHLRSVERLPL